MPQEHVASLDDSRLDPYRDLTRSNLTRWSNRFIAEGWRVVERLLASDFEVESVLVSDLKYARLQRDLDPNSTVLVIPQTMAEKLVGFNFHCGVLACGVRKAPWTMAQVVPRAPTRATLVACPHITGPENLGAIIRLCSGFGVNGLLLGPGSADPFSRRVLRVSMGAAFGLPIVQSTNAAADLQVLRDDYEFELVATVLDSTAERLERADRPARLGLLLGHEADGLGPKFQALCQRRVTITMDGITDSLNVATAAGIFLHHFQRAAPSRGDA